jgi:DNA-binding transcriptional regulator YdaS (Cro superfamily)
MMPTARVSTHTGRSVEIAVQMQAVRKAVEMVGGEEQLGARLGLSVGTVRLFATGRIRLPQRLFLQVVDIISGDPTSVENPADVRERRSHLTD